MTENAPTTASGYLMRIKIWHRKSPTRNEKCPLKVFGLSSWTPPVCSLNVWCVLVSRIFFYNCFFFSSCPSLSVNSTREQRLSCLFISALKTMLPAFDSFSCSLVRRTHCSLYLVYCLPVHLSACLPLPPSASLYACLSFCLCLSSSLRLSTYLRVCLSVPSFPGRKTVVPATGRCSSEGM